MTDNNDYDYYDGTSLFNQSILNYTNELLYDTSTYNISANDTDISVYNTSGYNSSAYNISVYNTSAYNTSGYNTSGYNTSGYNNNTIGSNDNDYTEVMRTYMWIGFMLTLVGLTYEMTSWCTFKKFRHFRNYLYLNVFLANMLYYLFCLFLIVMIENLNKNEDDVVSYVLALFFGFGQFVCSLAFNFWLLVLCYMFYLDYVKVFNVDIRRRYHKGNLFAWGIPFILGLVMAPGAYLSSYNFVILLIQSRHVIIAILMVGNFVLYITILYFIFRGSEVSDKWGCFYKATWIFVISLFILISSLIQTLDINSAFVGVGIFVKILNTIILDVYVITIKMNRELWGEYFKKRSAQASLVMKCFPKKNIS